MSAAPTPRRPRDDADRRDLWVGYLDSLGGHLDARPRTVKTAETVAAAIVRDIVARGLATGDSLPSETAMLAQYQVSRASLREGLRLLEVQGLIRLKPGPGGGPMVGAVDPKNLARMSTLYLDLGRATYAELRSTHLIIEPMVAEEAARNPDRDMVRDVLAPYLAENLPTTGSEYRWITSNFHAALHELVGNRFLELFVRSIQHIVSHHVIDPDGHLGAPGPHPRRAPGAGPGRRRGSGRQGPQAHGVALRLAVDPLRVRLARPPGGIRRVDVARPTGLDA
jgi:DNA-binding FadR family transcriptional regulator